MQNEQSRQLLADIGITNVDVTGDTRFDRVATIARQSKNLPVIETFVKSEPACKASDLNSLELSETNSQSERLEPRVFIAGSSWLPDEKIFIPYLNQHRDWKVIIAPHVIAESHISLILQLLGDRKVVRYTQLGADSSKELREAEVLIIDCFGLLSSIYKYGTVSYVGGGFGEGIHNLPEAAVWNIPVIFGPNNQKFREAQELKSCGGGIEITSYDDFAHVMDTFTDDPHVLQQSSDAAGNYVRSQSGATERLLQLLHESRK